MKPYRNLNGNSGVVAYDYGPDWIHVQFARGTVYEYTHSSAGARNIAAMKRLADKGSGLSTFISSTVKELYSKRVR